jgi:glycosyltransferase involved in cell wall biosynthesis
MANDVRSGYRFDLNRRLYTFAFRHLGITPVANSEHTRTTLGRGAGFAEKIDLGVNPEHMRIASGVAADGMPPRRPGRARLLVMSRLVETKGHMILLRAMLSRPELAEIDLIVCGGPLGTPYAAALRQEAAEHGAADRFHLLGPVKEVAAYYREADVVANARLDPEPFGLSIVEAMLVGKPILAHASGGPAEIVLDGVTGWHVTAPSVQAFAGGLARMIRDRQRWTEMGKAARDRALQHYTSDHMTGQLLAIVNKRIRRH